MTDDLFEQLADAEVPSLPERFDRQVHERLNRVLVAQHAAELLGGALPAAGAELLRALAAAAWYTLTGRYPAGGGEQRPPSQPGVP